MTSGSGRARLALTVDNLIGCNRLEGDMPGFPSIEGYDLTRMIFNRRKKGERERNGKKESYISPVLTIEFPSLRWGYATVAIDVAELIAVASGKGLCEDCAGDPQGFHQTFVRLCVQNRQWRMVMMPSKGKSGKQAPALERLGEPDAAQGLASQEPEPEPEQAAEPEQYATPVGRRAKHARSQPSDRLPRT